MRDYRKGETMDVAEVKEAIEHADWWQDILEDLDPEKESG